MIFAVLLTVLGVSITAPASHASGQDSVAHRDSIYGDLSDREHCVRNYALCIEREDIEAYASIFQDDCEFMTVMGKIDLLGDTLQESTIRTRGLLQELELMKGMFGAASEIHFSFEPGAWSRVDSLAGKACLDCWETHRKTAYSVVFNAESEGKAPASIAGSNLIWMYVSPVHGQWKIFRIIENESDDTGE